MEWIESSLGWAKSNQAIVWWLFAVSLVFCLATPLVVGWFVTRLPRDYFSKDRRPLEWADRYPVFRLALLIAKNLAGAVLVVAGIAMLMLPGQGLLTIVVGLVLLNFPGKFRLQRWLVRRPNVWRSINWLRKRAKREPLEDPYEDKKPHGKNNGATRKKRPAV